MTSNKENVNRIHILDQQTANQIAAGEVVERPFSVVKELVENAIDAQASAISVIIFDAQLEKIQVSDNGFGMSPEELRLSVLRHATSKINKLIDLDHLSTLGFRGEALPSIASVSQMTITSKQKDAASGYALHIQDGKATIPAQTAAKNGTTVVVDRLFFNAPARKKFLKTPRTEMGLISELIAKYIVAYPSVAFRLQNGAHLIFNSSGKGNSRHALFEAYGKSIADQMIPFAQGYLSPPSLNRANRNSYHFIINGRPARSRELSLAIDQAYFGFMPAHRYPIMFLDLNIAPERIDVNVHPGKLEVKFHNFSEIKDNLVMEIRLALGKSAAVTPSFYKKEEAVDVNDESGKSNTPASYENGGKKPEEALRLREKSINLGNDLYQVLYAVATAESPKPKEEERKMATLPLDKYIQENVFDTPRTAASDRLVYSSLTPLGQFAGTFIICAGEDYLYIIDQHAAAERVLYEKIAAQAKDNPGASSMLAVPMGIELSYQEYLQLTESIFQLREYGFILEHFGENSFVIRGVPLWYSGDDPEQLLRLFLDEINNDSASVVQIRKEELFMAACKQAVKANRYLTATDISVLFTNLDECTNSSTCPHGRPLAVKISRAEIYKRFLRGSI